MVAFLVVMSNLAVDRTASTLRVPAASYFSRCTTHDPMQSTTPRAFPEVLTKLHELEFDYDDGNGMDFEPYKNFTSEDETQSWFRAWTGNPNADGSKFWIFGQDGTGGYAAIWNIEADKGLLEQPIVFLGSEGELGVIAQNFSDYLWLLAGGNGPYEAVAYPDEQRPPNATFTNFALVHATGIHRNLSEVLADAKEKFPNFSSEVQALCS